MPFILSPTSAPAPATTPGVLQSTIKVQDLVHTARAYPELVPIFGTSGWSQEPALSIANDMMQEFLAQNFDWKFNRTFVKPFVTIALQQDYIGVLPGQGTAQGVLDLGWMEGGWRVDINNSVVPKPVFSMEMVRDLGRTSFQGTPFNVSWVPMPLALMGAWTASTSYPTGLGVAATPVSPIQQFIDANGNFLYVSTNGTSGAVQPVLPANSNPGTTVADGTVVWTVADPNGIAVRVAPLPGSSAIVWQIIAIYQKKPPLLTSLQQTIAPIPDTYGYLARSGFIAFCKEHAKPGSREALDAVNRWKEMIITALRSADRERDDASMYPATSIMTGSSFQVGPVAIGPGFPFDLFGGL